MAKRYILIPESTPLPPTETARVLQWQLEQKLVQSLQHYVGDSCTLDTIEKTAADGAVELRKNVQADRQRETQTFRQTDSHTDRQTDSLMSQPS